ncbi:MAG: (E)-4-hydroxy-3-methylbut-2-enyl-diphosphate synthase [Bacteroidetes bacterium]|nr:(E)-4-hydroxy-3-methylbut-2-enyl-diphosphate synthase [Bacteroidota bacterium]
MQDDKLFNQPFISRTIQVGHLTLGGLNPIRIQSMTTTNTLDTKATVSQAVRMIEAGAELVRITSPGLKEVETLSVIKNTLKNQGYNTPLIADIHFNPKVAEKAARIVEKIRINPGNYTGVKSGNNIKLTEKENRLETEKISEKISPLIKICKEYGTVIRVGVNHGSLSRRMINKYGNTPLGMVESAMEFLKICEDLQFHNLVLSMKSSNFKIMVPAYRLLVNRMLEEQMDYPLHLGVTEAGNGLDGRIKSSAGIGTLLKEGIGDTIRVSLTEEPENEIYFANSIVKTLTPANRAIRTKNPYFSNINPFEYKKRETTELVGIGGDKPPVVISTNANSKADFVFDQFKNRLQEDEKNYALINAEKRKLSTSETIAFIEFIISADNDFKKDMLKELKSNDVIMLKSVADQNISAIKKCISEIIECGIQNPIVLRRDYRSSNFDDYLILLSADVGSLLVDGLIDGLWINNSTFLDQTTDLCFRVLQSSGSRITATEYIACPSCGRTKFNIQKAFEEVKIATSHLIGLKIAVMGCIVNGPGEMADAHYGYVGSGDGKVSLYKGRKLINHGVVEQDAVKELISLIKLHGQWKEKPAD